MLTHRPHLKRLLALILTPWAVLPAVAQRTTRAADAAQYYRLKQVRIVDERGFERPLTALTLLIPADWQFQGTAQYAPVPGCHANLVRLAFRAVSPDGRLGVEMFPGNSWQWAEDSSAVGLLQANNRQLAQFGGHGCDIAPPLTPEEFLRRVAIPGFRREARVSTVEPIPDVTQQVEALARQVEQAAARQGVAVRVRAGAARARLGYTVNSQPVEEWLTAMTFSSGVAGPTFNLYTGRMGQTLYYTCGDDFVFGLLAPLGQLDSQDKFFRMVLSTIRVDPQWAARVEQAIANLRAQDSKGARDRSAIAAQSNRDIGNIINQTYADSSRGHDRAMEGWSQFVRGVETYRNPATGDTVDLSSQYGQAWAGPINEYIVTDSAGFDPNVTLRGNWTRLEPVRR